MIKKDLSRNDLLTDFGKATLDDRYLLPNEDYQDMFVRVALAYAENDQHAQRLYDYMSKLWFMPATPILSNSGRDKGLPISCFLNSVQDSMKGISDKWNENVFLASNGGGIGTSWSNVRSIGEKVRDVGKTSGIIPFICVQDSMTLAVSQGDLRRGSSAAYLHISHPEIEEFVEIRKASGDFNRKALNIHHGIMISNEFMETVKNGTKFELKSPKTKEVLRTVNARDLWQKILETRLSTGEPYIVFEDRCNELMPEFQKQLGLKVEMSNLCSEITLPVGIDYLGNERTAVCCLSSLNLETYDQWKGNSQMIYDIMLMLDNVLQYFIDNAPEEMKNAVYSAKMERSVGLGVMGFHSFLQSKNIPFESAMAKSWNLNIFKWIKKEVDFSSQRIGEIKGSCEDFRNSNLNKGIIYKRFACKTSIAPTASISIIAGGTSACIEPIPANIYTAKTLSGNFSVRNKYLERLLESKGKNTNETWSSIIDKEGSVQHLDFLTQDEKDVFKTAFEIDQMYVIEFAADRTPLIDQSQSVNLYLAADIDKYDLHMIHWKAWEKGLKSLYYCRSKSIRRAENVGSVGDKDNKRNYDECLSCQ